MNSHTPDENDERWMLTHALRLIPASLLMERFGSMNGIRQATVGRGRGRAGYPLLRGPVAKIIPGLDGKTIKMEANS